MFKRDLLLYLAENPPIRAVCRPYTCNISLYRANANSAFVSPTTHANFLTHPSLETVRALVQSTAKSSFSQFKANSHTSPVGYQRAMPSAAALETAEVLKELQEESALQGPRSKEYPCIKNSLAHPYLRPDTKRGFVIVRAVYGPSSDGPWAQMLELLRDNVSDRLEDQIELLPRHEMTIIEDRSNAR